MKEEPQSYRWVMAATTLLMMFALGASWFCFIPLALTLTEDLTLTFEQVGILIALVPLSLVILCIPGGLFADRFGVRKTVLIGGITMGIFGLLRGFATDFTTLATTMFLCGVGYAISYPNLPKITGIWFQPKEYALASGVMFIGMEVGMSLPLVLIPALLLPWIGSWQGVFTAIGVLSLTLTAIWTILAKERPKSAAASLQMKSPRELKGIPFRESLSTVLRNKHMWILMLTTFFLLAPQIGLIGFLQTMLILKGTDPTTAGLISSMISWFMIPSSFITPMLSDRIGLRKPFIWVTSILAGAALYLVGTTTGTPLWISVAIYGFLIGGMAPIILAMPVELAGTPYSATAGGLTLVGGYLGALVAPWLAGYLTTATGSFLPAIIMCTAMTEIDAICGLMLKESRQNKQNTI